MCLVCLVWGGGGGRQRDGGRWSSVRVCGRGERGEWVDGPGPGVSRHRTGGRRGGRHEVPLHGSGDDDKACLWARGGGRGGGVKTHPTGSNKWACCRRGLPHPGPRQHTTTPLVGGGWCPCGGGKDGRMSKTPGEREESPRGEGAQAQHLGGPKKKRRGGERACVSDLVVMTRHPQRPPPCPLPHPVAFGRNHGRTGQHSFFGRVPLIATR